MKKFFLIFLFFLTLCSCGSQSNDPKIFDKEHHSMYFCDVPVINGKDAIIETLLKMGFTPTEEPSFIDLSVIGKEAYNHQSFDGIVLSMEMEYIFFFLLIYRFNSM